MRHMTITIGFTSPAAAWRRLEIIRDAGFVSVKDIGTVKYDDDFAKDLLAFVAQHPEGVTHTAIYNRYRGKPSVLDKLVAEGKLMRYQGAKPKRGRTAIKYCIP